MQGISSLRAMKLEGLTLNKVLRRSTLEPIVFALKLALIIGCFVLLVLTLYNAIQGSLSAGKSIAELEQNIEQSKQRAGSQKETTAKSLNYKIIADKSLFGTLTQTSMPSTAAPPKPVVKTPFNLIGTFITDDEPPYAIIEDDKKKIQDVFEIGESIFGEAKLVAVRSDRVEIDRNGARETLIIDDSPSKGDSKGGVVADGDRFSVDEAELDRALENLPLLLTQARAVPYFRDGKATGLRLFAVKSGSLYEKLGLRNGDILKSVNGNSLADLSQAMQLFEKLKSDRSIAVTLERNSEEKEFKYDIR